MSDDDGNEDVRTALGVDEDVAVDGNDDGENGPNVDGDGSTDRTADSELYETAQINPCLICSSEIDGGGVMQRKSMAYAIQSVQNLHDNKDEWKSFKQNWEAENNEDDNDDECEKDQNGSSHLDDTDGPQPSEPLPTPASNDDDDVDGISNSQQYGFRSAILRASQVQEWNIIEKDKEIDRLRRKLEESESEKRTMRQMFDQEKAQLENQITDLQSKVKKQAKAINQELKMIKSIATKRAGARTNGKLVTVDASNPPQSPGRKNGQSNGSVVQREAPPQLPARKASENLGGIVGSSLNVVPLDYTFQTGRTKDQHPQIPVRQASDKHQISQSTSSLQPSSSEGSEIRIKYPIDRNISFNNHQNNIAPSIPLRQPSQETELSKVSEATLSMVTGAEFSVESSTDHFVRSEITMDTYTGEVMQVLVLENKGDSDDNVGTGDSGKVPASSTVGTTNLGASQEISFIPTEMEILASPQQSTPSPESTNRKTHDTRSDAKGTISSQEIQFDASTTFNASINTARKPSVKEMRFDESQQLLMEASQALSLPSIPAHPTQKHRKTESGSSGTPNSGNDTTKKDIVFDTSPNPSPRRQSTNVFKPVQSSSTEEQPGEVLGDKAAGAADENEQDDDDGDDDFFESLPGGLPVGSDRFLDIHRSTHNISPVSALTTGSYLYDNAAHGDEDDEEDGPMKGLHQGVTTKQLPMEANFDSDDEEEDDEKGPGKKKLSKNGLAAHLQRNGANVSPSRKPHQKTPKKTIHVESSQVKDKYGDGGKYTGSILLESRLPHGNGHMIYENGREFDGDWKAGRWHGKGRWVNPNGDCYEGTFVYDARHGTGTYTWKNGNVYTGDFHEDKRQGQGSFHFANGNVFVGQFNNGVFEGRGRYTFEGGSYDGEWRSGRYHGEGNLLFADGSSYQGHFNDGVADGEGAETSVNGTVRRGYWKNGRPVQNESDGEDK